MEISDFVLSKSNNKKSNSLLDKEYKRLINKIIQNSTEIEEVRWGTYNLIIKELISLHDCEYFEEIKYRLTDGENPNEVLIDVIARYNPDDLSYLITFLMKRVEEYWEEDFLKRFY